MVTDIARAIRSNTTRPQRCAFMKKMMPSYADDELLIRGDDFEKWVLQYLLSPSTDGIQSQLHKLRDLNPNDDDDEY